MQSVPWLLTRFWTIIAERKCRQAWTLEGKPVSGQGKTLMLSYDIAANKLHQGAPCMAINMSSPSGQVDAALSGHRPAAMDMLHGLPN